MATEPEVVLRQAPPAAVPRAVIMDFSAAVRRVAAENSMITRVGGDGDGDSDGQVSSLVAQVHRHSRTVIDAELRRLSRRTPSLRPDDLDLVDAALEHLVESLILSRLRGAPEEKVALLRPLFATPNG